MMSKSFFVSSLLLFASSVFASCSSEHAEIAASREYFNSTEVRASLGEGSYAYFYFNAKQGERFVVSLPYSSGNPDLFVSRAAKNLFPTSSTFEESSTYPSGIVDEVTINPSAEECYAIGVKALQVSSFVLRIIVADSELPPASEEFNCINQFPRENFEAGSLFEGNATALSATTALGANGYKYFYLSAKQGLTYNVSIPFSSGDPNLVMARAIYSFKPFSSFSSPKYEWISSTDSNWLLITPPISECYAIAVNTDGPSAFAVKVALAGSALPQVLPEDLNCRTQFPHTYFETGTLIEGNSSIVLPVFWMSGSSKKYFYMNAKQGVTYKVSLPRSSGSPALFLSRAAYSLEPLLSDDVEKLEWRSDDSRVILFTPPVGECYVIAVTSVFATSFTLQVEIPGSPLPVDPAEALTCKTQFPSYKFDADSLAEGNASIIFPVTSSEEGLYRNYFLSGKEGVTYTVSIPQFSGNPSLRVSRAAYAYSSYGFFDIYYELSANGASGHGLSITFTPTINECYLISVKPNIDSTYRLQIEVPGSKLPEEPSQNFTCAIHKGGTTFGPTGGSLVISGDVSSALPVFSLERGQIKEFYFVAKQGVSYNVSIPQYSGELALIISRGIYAMYPYSFYESGQAEYRAEGKPLQIVFTPPITECYVAAVRTAVASSFNLQVEVAGSPLPEFPENTCKIQYPNGHFREESLIDGTVPSTILPVSRLGENAYRSYYLSAQQGITYNVSVVSGEPELYIARTVHAFDIFTHPSGAYEWSSVNSRRKWILITATVSECYVIAVKSRLESTSYVLRVDALPAGATLSSAAPLTVSDKVFKFFGKPVQGYAMQIGIAFTLFGIATVGIGLLLKRSFSAKPRGTSLL